jgi:hypothetical protein
LQTDVLPPLQIVYSLMSVVVDSRPTIPYNTTTREHLRGGN